MASSLRARLNAISSTVPASPKVTRPSGVLHYSARVKADPGLFALDAVGLRRIGWSGRKLEPARLLFLDTETTGLSGGAGTIAFLVGIGYIEGKDFVVEQFLMRDYADEPSMLMQLAERMRNFDAVCTFNGKNFDLPLLQTRYTMCRIRECYHELEQLDLLYPARRTWKLRLGCCKLSHLEVEILSQPREHDLPGSEVPQRYFDFLKSGDIELLGDIISHNQQDIITLGLLLVKLTSLYAQPEAESRREDLFSMGKALEHQGEIKPARELYRIAAIPAPAGSISSLTGNTVAALAAWRSYLLARKNRDYEDMLRILEQMVMRRQLREKTYLELAKLAEHHMKNPRRALRYALLAARYLPTKDKPALEQRIKRLNQKIKRIEEKSNHGLF